MASQNFTDNLDRIEDFIGGYAQRLPSLPNSWKQFLTVFIPWYIILIILLNIPVFLSLAGLGFLVAPLGYLFGSKVTGITVSLVITACILVLQIMALKGLFAKTSRSWKLLFYTVLLGVVQNIFIGSLFGILIGNSFALYLLFQIKSFYR